MPLTDQDKNTLLSAAFQSIDYTLEKQEVMQVSAEDYNESLQENRATFITVKKSGQLRGCIGMIDPVRPLIEDVVKNAHAASFKDPRFSPLSPSERDDLDIYISVLSLRENIEFMSEEDLLSQFRPGVDGLVLEDDLHCGAFLPVMWKQLPDRRSFWRQLKIKANLPPNYWSDSLRVTRFTSEYYIASNPDPEED